MTCVRLQWILALGGLAACTPLGNSGITSPEFRSNQPVEAAEMPLIVCALAYRDSPTKSIQQEQDVRLSAQHPTQVVQFDDLQWQAQYWPPSSPNGGSLKLSVFQVEGTKETKRQTIPAPEPRQESALEPAPTPGQQVLAAQLYQFDGPQLLQTQFVGGHGFTGLNYSYSSNATGELQYWCSSAQVSS